MSLRKYKQQKEQLFKLNEKDDFNISHSDHGAEKFYKLSRNCNYLAVVLRRTTPTANVWKGIVLKISENLQLSVIYKGDWLTQGRFYFSPDSQYFISQGNQHEVLIFSLSTEQETAVKINHDYQKILCLDANKQNIYLSANFSLLIYSIVNSCWKIIDVIFPMKQLICLSSGHLVIKSKEGKMGLLCNNKLQRIILQPDFYGDDEELSDRSESSGYAFCDIGLNDRLKRIFLDDEFYQYLNNFIFIWDRLFLTSSVKQIRKFNRNSNAYVSTHQFSPNIHLITEFRQNNQKRIKFIDFDLILGQQNIFYIINDENILVQRDCKIVNLKTELLIRYGNCHNSLQIFKLIND